MNVKEYLGQIKKMDIMIQNKEYEIKSIREDAQGLKSMDYGSERVQTSRTGDRMAEWVNKILEAEDDAVILKRLLTETRTIIINQINSLDNTLYLQILFKHYVEYKPLKDIAKDLNYEYEYIRHAHGWALEAFRKKHFKNSK